MSEFRAAAWAIRFYFHADPGKLTLRRFVDLGGKGVAYVRGMAAKPPPVESPGKTEHF